MPKQIMDYSKTIIYKIVCNDLDVTETYVGHTTNIVKRRCCHKSSCNNEKDKYYNLKIYQTIRANKGWDNWSVIQICEFPCNNQEEARTEERRHYEMLNASLNMINPCRGRKEWYEANPDYNKNYKRVYYEVNRDTILEKQREYRDTNKEIIAEMKKIKYTCCCGSTIQRDKKTRHEQTQKHLNYVNTK
jgi:hypothetical protein